MSKFKVNDKVYIKDHTGGKWYGTIISINEFRNPEMKYGLYIEDLSKNTIYMSEEKIYLVESDYVWQ